MSRYNSLPFPRGETYWNGDSNLISASQATQLEGKTYMASDTTSGLASGSYVTLRVVRNKNSGRLGGPGRPTGSGVRFGTTAGWLGTKVRGYTGALTDFGMAIDDAYTTSVATGDLFYVVERGPAKCAFATKTTGSGTMASGDTVNWGASGLLYKTANSTALAHPYGEIQEAITSGVTGNRAAVVFVGGLFADKN